MIPESIQELCASGSVTSLMNENKDLTPSKAYDKLVPEKTPPVVSAIKQKHSGKVNDENYYNISEEDLEAAKNCGNFEGTEPSPLFLKIFHHVLRTLEKDPRAGVVSPSLLGSTGVVPLTVMSIIPDILRHYANLIVRARKSIILATNFWAASYASHIVTDALRELSRRRLEAGLPPVDVKILYDRGNIKQTVKHHIEVEEKEYTGDKVKIPRQDEVKGITLQVVNFHVPPVGTYHAKWMVVDGRVAVLNSNNIQDVANLEMMVHYEGPIVDSFYDSAMISWHNALFPELEPHKFFHEDPTRHEFDFSDRHTIARTIGDHLKEETVRFRTGYLRTNAEAKSEEIGRNGRDLIPFAIQLQGSDTRVEHQLPSKEEAQRVLVAGDHDPPTSEIPANESVNGQPGPMGMGGPPVIDVHALPDQAERSTSTPPPTLKRAENTGHIGRAIATEENQDEVARVLEKGENIGDGEKMLASIHDAVKIEYDETFSGEAERVRTFLGTIEKVTKHLNTTIQPNTKGTLLETDVEAHVEAFNPYILHPPHKPFPIAMVNRRPFGPPGHQSLRVPQNEAWLASLRLAEKQIFIQTPDLNASDLVEEIPKTVKRGVEVVLYLTLGYNDAGELLPFQNGTNEQIVCGLFKELADDEKERLKVYWYTAKDMRKPIYAKTKQRTSHIKLMIVDGQIGIQGSGNQDTQSWYHSQETNVMIDSKEVVQEWLWGIRSNQNTHLYGRVDNDGAWRARVGRDIIGEDCPEGEGIEGTMGGGKIKFGWVKGIKGAIERVQGVGGF
ncbi:hypothetical protein TWF694_007772 [Orbilia ellipsospora]|uniref:PLD phosphodiesterase domain-containing protein n=1 Tax=Orbilia ellipsospora TaxID=2528407 RepID=A0AAV9XIQ0_9PEZI